MDSPPAKTSLSVGLLILRVGMGAYMLTHGAGKLNMWMQGKGAGFPDPIGIGNELSLIMAVLTECGGALCVALGLLTRVAAGGLVFTMAVAAFVVHGGDPWMMSGKGPSKEPALLYLIPFLALIFTGPGRFAVDAWLATKLRKKGD